MRPYWLVLAIVITLSSALFGQSNSVPLLYQPLSPASAQPGGLPFALTVTGTGFVSGSVISWNGGTLATTFVSPSQLTAIVPGSNIATAATASIRVFNPSPGGGTSNVVFFPIAMPEFGVYYNFLAVPTSPETVDQPIEGDFNNDGIPDVIGVKPTISQLTLLLGNGDGTFQSPTLISPLAGNDPTLVSTGDFNNDGNLDFVVSNPSLVIQVYLGNGDGTFSAVNTDLSSFTNVLSGVVQGDFNADGKLDLACLCETTATTAIEILLGKGDGGFQTPIQSPVAPNPGALGLPIPAVVADLNDDNIPDLIVMSPSGGVGSPVSGTIQVLLGNGDGTFQQGAVYTLLGDDDPKFLLPALLHNDSALDVIVIENYGNFGCNTDIQIFAGTGDGTLQPPVEYGSLSGCGTSAALSDLDGDGTLDLALTTFNSPGIDSIYAFFGNADGSFRLFSPSIVNGAFATIGPAAYADFDGDGRIDMLATSNLAPDLTLFSQTTPPLVPTVGFSVYSLAFGQQGIGTTSQPQTFTITSSGNTPLSILSIGVTGANPEDFAETNTCPSSLASGSDCEVSVTFTPTAPNTRAASLSISDNAVGSPHVIDLAGNAPLAGAVSPENLIFAPQAIGTTSSPQAVTLTNLGSQPLTITSIGMSGANGLDFAQTNNCGSSLAVNANCEIDITFTPIAGGARSAFLVVNDDGIGPNTVNLSGNMVSAAVFSPSALGFAQQPVGTTSSPQQLLFSNLGVSPLAITAISVTGTNATDFAQTNNCGSNLAVGASCQISATFTPPAPGPRLAAITISDSAPGSPQNVSLTGNSPPLPVLFPISLDFGSQTVGITTVARTIALSNAGLEPLSISNTTITGTSASDYQQSSTCGSTVAPNGNCQFTVTFTPTAPGLRTASLVIADNGGTGSQSATLTGTGVAAPPDFSLAITPPTPATITAGGSAISTVTISSLGGFTGTVTFSCSGLPINITCSFAPTSVPGGGGISTLTLATTSSTSAGTYSALITASSGPLSDEATAALTVDSAVPPTVAIGPAPGSSSSATVRAGAPASFNLAVSAANFAGALTLTCNVSPSVNMGPSCNVPSSVSVSGGTATFVVTVSTIGSSRSAWWVGHAMPTLWATLLLVCFVFFSTQRRRGTCLVIIAIFTIHFSGCGGGSGAQPTGTLGTPSGRYTITVTGTANNVSSSTELTLTVQ